MDNEILKSVIEITRHHDLESLEYAFVTTLRELLPIRTITLHRLLKANKINNLEEMVRFNVSTGPDGKINYDRSRRTRVIDARERLQHCLSQRHLFNTKQDDGHYLLLMAICSNDKVLGALELTSDDDMATFLPLIEDLANIYGNYMSILNESERDTLTGLLNRRTFDHKLSRLLKSQRESNERKVTKADASAWLAVVDIDHFKRVNDAYGHVYGDEILLVLSQKMRDSFRKGDLLFRVGGEEFVIILAPISSTGAAQALERFRKLVAAHAFPQIGTITVSIGYAQIEPGDYPRRIFDLADKALYYAKDNGRNQVIHYEDLIDRGAITEQDQTGSIELF